MKKLLFIPFILLVMVSMAACGSSGDDSFVPDEEPGASVDSVGNGRYLVIYCSRSGNTEKVARQISTTLNCDILEVEPATAYEGDYNAMLDRAREELAAIDKGNYLAITTSVDDVDKYDLIFIGYPIWYGRMATPMQTFLHEHASKLSGKRVALFVTSGSSGMSTSANEARGFCPQATFTATLLLTSSELGRMESRVETWFEELGVTREEEEDEEAGVLKVKITVGDRIVTATMEDNATAKAFLARLPLEVELSDYAGAEKIFYPSPKLSTEEAPRGGNPTAGSIMLYEPWGNVAIFYKSGSASNSLIPMGRVDGDGIEVFRVSGSLNVKFER